MKYDMKQQSAAIRAKMAMPGEEDAAEEKAPDMVGDDSGEGELPVREQVMMVVEDALGAFDGGELSFSELMENIKEGLQGVTPSKPGGKPQMMMPKKELPMEEEEVMKKVM